MDSDVKESEQKIGSDVAHFEKQMKRQLTTFQEKQDGTYRKPTKHHIDHYHKGLEVTLVVRMRKYSALDEKFTTIVDTISESEAEMVAKQRARDKGWAWIAYVHSVTPKTKSI